MALIFCDIETTSLDATHSLSHQITRVGIQRDGVDEEPISYMWGDVYEILTDLDAGDNTFVFHNAAFDVPCLRLRGYNIEKFHDTMAMSYCLNPSNMMNHSLSACAERVGEHKTHYDFESEEVDEEALSSYNINDIIIMRKAFLDMEEKLRLDERLYEFYLTIEVPYIEVIIEMLSSGVHMDKDELHAMKTALSCDEVKSRLSMREEVGYLKGKEVIYSKKTLISSRPMVFSGFHKSKGVTIYDHCKLEEFNPNSSAQIQVAFEKLGFREFTEFTAGGSPSFTKESLENIPHPLATKLVRHKNITSTLVFLPPLIEGCDSHNRLRCNFNQFNTATGRLSSSHPNLQNITTSKEEGANIRKCFTAGDGNLLLVGDLNRIELVVLAYYLELVLGFTDMSDAVRAGEDLHQSNADLWHCERRVAKTVIFCLVYGGGANKIAHITGITVKEAKQVIKRIYATTPIEELKEKLIAHARKNRGCFKDVMGRLLRVEGILYDRDSEEYARASRQVFNYLIQGSAGSVFKVLQIGAQRALPNNISQQLQVHDEVVYECSESCAEEFKIILTDLYTNDTLLSTEEFNVPITCSFGVGKNWSDAKV